MAGDLLGLLDALDLGTVAAGGVSMGCATTLLAAQEAPERFGALVLACPPTAWDTRAAQADLYRAGAALVETEGIDALADVIAGLPVPRLFEATPEPELAHFEPDVTAAALPAVLQGAAASDLPDPESLRALDTPALVLAWEGDRGHPVSTAERLAEVLPAAELVVAADLDAVRRWPPLVADWLARTL